MAYSPQSKILTVKRSAANLPQGTAAAIFTITGDIIEIIEIVGVVTTQIQNQANATKLIANPTTGSDDDLCATLDIDNDAVGTIYTLPAALISALNSSTNQGVILGPGVTRIVRPGTIDLSCAGSSTGQIAWHISYRSYNGSYVTAV